MWEGEVITPVGIAKPQDLDASTKIGNDTAGSLLRINVWDKRRLRRITRFQMGTVVRMSWVTTTLAVRLSLKTAKYKHDTSGRQNG